MVSFRGSGFGVQGFLLIVEDSGFCDSGCGDFVAGDGGCRILMGVSSWCPNRLSGYLTYTSLFM